MTTKTTMTTQARHYASAAQLEGSGISTWLTRGANFVVAVSQGSAGSVLSRDENPDEYMVYLVDAAAVIEAGGQRIEAKADSLTIVPPGARSGRRLQRAPLPTERAHQGRQQYAYFS